MRNEKTCILENGTYSINVHCMETSKNCVFPKFHPVCQPSRCNAMHQGHVANTTTKDVGNSDKTRRYLCTCFPTSQLRNLGLRSLEERQTASRNGIRVQNPQVSSTSAPSRVRLGPFTASFVLQLKTPARQRRPSLDIHCSLFVAPQDGLPPRHVVALCKEVGPSPV